MIYQRVFCAVRYIHFVWENESLILQNIIYSPQKKVINKKYEHHTNNSCLIAFECSLCIGGTTLYDALFFESIFEICITHFCVLHVVENKESQHSTSDTTRVKLVYW